jgi:hypothetical protein
LYLGYRGERPGADTIVQGQPPPPALMDQLLPETQSIINTLSAIDRNKLNPFPSIVHPEDFKNCYKVMAERTSSSPSGRHIEHYKAALSSPDLVK